MQSSPFELTADCVHAVLTVHYSELEVNQVLIGWQETFDEDEKKILISNTKIRETQAPKHPTYLETLNTQGTTAQSS